MATAHITGLKELNKKLSALQEKLAKPASVRAGVIDGGTYPDGTSVAQAAFWQEYGTASIPARPFMRSTVSKQRSKWLSTAKNQLKATNLDIPSTLGRLGLMMQEDIQESIRETYSPALSPITLMLRKMVGNSPELITGRMVGEAAQRVAAGEQGSSNSHPLIWTGRLLRTITSRVD